MTIIIGTILFCFIFTIISQYAFWLNRQLKKKNVYIHWHKFIEAVENQNIDLIKYYSDKLIWNRYINQNQIDSINTILNSLIEEDPSLSDLYQISKNRHSQLSTLERIELLEKYGTIEMLRL